MQDLTRLVQADSGVAYKAPARHDVPTKPPVQLAARQPLRPGSSEILQAGGAQPTRLAPRPAEPAPASAGDAIKSGGRD